MEEPLRRLPQALAPQLRPQRHKRSPRHLSAGGFVVLHMLISSTRSGGTVQRWMVFISALLISAALVGPHQTAVASPQQVSVASPQQVSAAAKSQRFCGIRVDKRPIPKWGPIAIQAQGVSCGVAVKLAVTAAKKGFGTWKINGWSCTYAREGVCKSGSKRVIFGWGN